MNKPAKIIIGIVITIILIAVGYFLYKKFAKPVPVPESDIDTQGKKISWSDDEFPIKKGSSGNRVKQLQAGLNILNNENLALDGKFGDKTLAALNEHYKVTQLSEAAYNTYIKPNLNKIDEYIASKHPANAKTSKPTSATPPSNSLFTINNDTALIGKSVWAALETRGFIGKKVNDKYVLDDSKPIEYASGQFIGVVQNDNNGWLQCMRTNGDRVFVLKSKVKKM